MITRLVMIPASQPATTYGAAHPRTPRAHLRAGHEEREAVISVRLPFILASLCVDLAVLWRPDWRHEKGGCGTCHATELTRVSVTRALAVPALLSKVPGW